jgi:uncharacterized phage protein gp47/JayE
MATPQPKSYEQFLGDMLRAYIAKTGINDLNTGSAVTAFYEAVALEIARTSGDVFQLLRDLSVDRAKGDALRKIAKDEGLQELPARVASGQVTVTDTSFSKISTKIYAGANPPNIGSNTILVSDATDFPAVGSVYIGRGSPNVEGPIAYSAKTPIGGYWAIVLTSPTTKFHNINESVILAQGGVRNIQAGTVVRAPASGSSPDINFSVTKPAVILDGETTVDGVQVSAQEPGTGGNVPIGAIREFSADPFSGASVTNALPFKTGRDVETDEELQIRIKRARLSKGLGTVLAVKNSVIGATPSDENATIVSSEILTSSDGLTTLFVDDGTGYESKTNGVGIEVLVDAAIGGEDHFQLKTGGRQTSIAKAFIVSNLKAPFDVAGTDKLSISIGGTVTEHTFSDSDFVSPGGATGYEIVASINANTALGFSAATVNGGTQIILFGKVESNEAIQAQEVTSGRNVATLIGLPSNKVETARLFKNKVPLSKDGAKATISSAKQVDWSASIASGDTLILSVDGTASITYSILDADFIAQGTYTTVSAGNSLESWVAVLNNKLTGVTAAIVGERITITSNLGQSNRAKVSIDASSTLVTKGMFSTAEGLTSSGKAADYQLSRNTAQVRLNTPLSAGDSLTAGTQDTEARIQSSRILGGTVTLSSDAYFWLMVDDELASLVSTAVVANTIINVTKPSANIVRYSSTSPSAFSNVQVGDYVIVWSQELSAANRLEGRVHAVSALNLDIKVASAEYAAAVVEGPIVFQDGFVVLRSKKVPQKFKVGAGTKSLSEIADELNLQSTNCKFSVFDDEILVLNTLTKTDSGAILVVTADTNAKPISLPVGTSNTSNESLYAFYESGFIEGGFPLFVHSDFASDSSGVPPDSYISSIGTGINLSAAGLDPNFIVGYLQPYGNILDALSPSENTPLDSYSGSNISIEQDKFVKRLRVGDRWYAANPLDFGQEEEMIVVLDGDASNKTFTVPFYRRTKTNSTLAVNPNSFNAYDLDAGLTAPFTTYFSSSYKFDNYKVLMRARNVLDPSGIQNALLYRSTQWGRSGEKVNIGYIYPTSANSPISSVVTVDKNVNISISLKSGATIPTTIDGSTEWDVTITPNTPSAGIDQVTYSWTGTGSAPGLTGLAGGEYVNILSGSQLDPANTGTFRISTEAGFAPTSTSFTVARQNGSAVAESNKATLVANVFSFYASSATTGSEIQSYVASSLSNFLEATIVNDTGLSGGGTIVLSTFEDSGFTYSSIFLKDGLNWIASTNLAGSPQFTFKKSLDLPTAQGYAFTDGEEIRLVPTNLEQLVSFLNVLAVTGYTTLGRINTTRRDGRLELSTKTLGGDGSVQVVGGQANASETPVLGTSLVSENKYVLTNVNKSGLDGLHSDQWVRLESANKQKKETLFKSSMSVRIESNVPTSNQSTITLGNRTLADRHFGKPRHHVRTRSRNFKVERQGNLTCFSWDGTGTQPFFEKLVNLDDASGGTLNVQRVTGTSETQYIILTGNTNFTEVSIGDLISVQNMLKSANNGTFLVTGVSSDGKILRVLNANGQDQFSTGTFTITDNTDISGDSFIVNGNVLIAGVDFVVGGSASVSAQNLASTISALPGVSATSFGNVVTILADNASANITISYVNTVGSPGAVASGPSLAGDTFSSGDFSCTTEVAENDTIIIGSPFNILNQGKYRIVRRYNNSFYVENLNSVEELVSIPYNPVSLGFDGTTGFDIVASDNKIVLSWDGSGTEPQLGNAKVGDEITFGSDFAASNQGTWMVSKSQGKLKEVTKITTPQGSLIGAGQYFYLNAAEDSTLYYVWYKVNGIGVDPAVVGRTGILVNIASTDTSSQVASLTAAAIDVLADFVATSSGSSVRVTNAAFGPSTDAANINVGGGIVIQVVQQGQRTSLEAINAAAVSESGIVVTDVLEIHRPPFLTYEYEATVADDTFMITSDFLGSSNQGNWKVLSVLDQDRIVVSGAMSDLDPTGVLGNQGNLILEERTPFTGYKHIRMITVDPANTLQRGIVVFDTRYQSNRINEASGTQISAVGKMEFSEVLRKGLDSYRYDIGLIGEANRIVYGEPRDNTTYPGVAAAGAEIFIRPPLIRRVKVGVAVRLETGIPFSQIVEQVRTNVSALINGNPIGVPIAISDIVAAVNAIPGVRAMVITSPLYNISNDTINIGPSEKAKVIDPVNDISTTQIN